MGPQKLLYDYYGDLGSWKFFYLSRYGEIFSSSVAVNIDLSTFYCSHLDNLSIRRHLILFPKGSGGVMEGPTCFWYIFFAFSVSV